MKILLVTFLFLFFATSNSQFIKGNAAYLFTNSSQNTSNLFFLKTTRARSGFSFFAISKNATSWIDALVVGFWWQNGVPTYRRLIGGAKKAPTGIPHDNKDGILVNCLVPDLNFYPLGYYMDETNDGCFLNENAFEKSFGKKFFVTIGSNKDTSPGSKLEDIDKIEMKEVVQWPAEVSGRTLERHQVLFALGHPYPRIEYVNMGYGVAILLVYILTFLLLIACFNQEPLRSRGLLPLMAWFFQAVPYVLTVLAYWFFSLEDYARMQPSIMYFLQYSSNICMMCIAFVLFGKFISFNSLNRQKAISEAHRFDKDQGRVKPGIRLLKFLTAWWSTPLIVVFFWIFPAFIFLVIYAACQFRARLSEWFIFYGYIAFLVILGIPYILTVATDIIVNRRRLRAYRIVDIWKEDVFWYRFEIYIVSIGMGIPLLVTCAILLQFWPVSYQIPLSKAILTSLMGYYMWFMQNGFIVIVTSVLFIIRLFKKGGSTEHCKRVMENPDGSQLFLAYAKKEWTSENYLCYDDIQRYNEESDQINKKRHALDIFDSYLNGHHSHLEVNISRHLCKSVKDKIDTGIAPQTLFADVEKALLKNLTDTFSRFIHTKEYKDLDARERFLKQSFEDPSQ